MVKISLVEMHGHSEVLTSFWYALKEFELSIFVYNSSLEINLPESTIHFSSTNQSAEDYLLNNKDHIENSDWIIFITIEKYFKFFARQTWKSKTVLVIYDGNYWLNYYRNVTFQSPKDIFRFIKAFFYRDQYYKREIINRMNYITFQNDTIKDFFIDSCSISKNKVFPCLPFYLPLEKSKFITQRLTNTINITIPGAIRKDTRDFDVVFRAFKQSEKYFNKNVNLTLLGKPLGLYGKKILKKFCKLRNDRVKVNYYDNYVTNEVYDNVMKESSLIILPTRKTMKYYNCIELPGLTKMSNILNDVIRFDLPIILPNSYYLTPDIEHFVYRYTNSFDLSKKLIDLINGNATFQYKSIPIKPVVGYDHFFKENK